MGVTVPYYKYFNWNEYVNYNDGYGAILIDEVEGTLDRQTPYLRDFKDYIGNNATDMYPVPCNFNQKVKLPPSQASCYRMFMNCTQYNQPITLTSKVTNCNHMFYSASAFNQPVTIGAKVTDCSYMFYLAKKMNQPVILGANVTNACQMFFSASNFGQSITIPSSVTNAYAMFQSTKVTNVYINCVGRTAQPDVFGLINAVANTYTKYVYCNNISYINGTGNNHARTISSICGNTITWSPVANGYYNATYNVYIYNNYTG